MPETSVELLRRFLKEGVALLTLIDERAEHVAGDVRSRRAALRRRTSILRRRTVRRRGRRVVSIHWGSLSSSLTLFTRLSGFFLDFFIFDCLGSCGTIMKPSSESKASSSVETE